MMERKIGNVARNIGRLGKSERFVNKWLPVIKYYNIMVKVEISIFFK